MRGAIWTTRLATASFMLAGGMALADCPPQPTTHEPSAESPLNIDKVKAQLRKYHDEFYEQDIAAIIDAARAYLESRAPAVTDPALVLDIDETSLTNWPNISADDFGFIPDGSCSHLPKGPCGFNTWIMRHTSASIRPTLELFNEAKRTRVAIFFVTARTTGQRAATVANLHKAGFTGWTGLMLRPPSDKRPIAEYKSEQRNKISAQGFTIIVNVGDQQSDLDGGNAECPFKLPNPFYFIP
jgi:predicted secreted acid phosphatase